MIGIITYSLLFNIIFLRLAKLNIINPLIKIIKSAKIKQRKLTKNI